MSVNILIDKTQVPNKSSSMFIIFTSGLKPEVLTMYDSNDQFVGLN